MRLHSRFARRVFLRAVSLAGLGISAQAALLACAPVPSAPSQPASGSDQPAQDQQPAPPEEIVLRLHFRAGGDKSEQALYIGCPGLLTEEHPNIKVELDPIPGGEFEAKVQTMAAAQTLGDVMWTAAHSGYHRRLTRLGVILLSDDQLDANGLSKDEWVPAAVGQLTWEGKMYGMPKNCHPGAAHIWINEEMFEEAGLPIPETYGHTRTEVTEWARAMAKGPGTARRCTGICSTAETGNGSTPRCALLAAGSTTRTAPSQVPEHPSGWPGRSGH